MHRCISSALMTVAVFATVAGLARADTILTLSDRSSDGTSVEALDARLSFDVVGESLMLTAMNDTSGVDGFDLAAIYFNARPDILELLPAPAELGWTLFLNERANGYGMFDFALISDLGNDPAKIGPGESLTFTFDIVGHAPFSDASFTRAFSSIPPGDHPVLAAAKFVSGPGGDSGFGAVVPEPGTILLTLAGLGLVGRATRRR
jgi:hypothetical protein